MKTCPICELEISESIPSFCSQCGWDLKNDPTLVPSLDNIPDEFLEDYRQRVEIARSVWNSRSDAIRKKKELEECVERLKSEKEDAWIEKLSEDKIERKEIKQLFDKVLELASRVDVWQDKGEEELRQIAINQTIKSYKKAAEGIGE
jgi:hypothetical protein